MKALWLGFSLLLAVQAPLASAQRRGKVRLSTEQLSQINASLSEYGKALAGSGAKEIMLGDTREYVIGIANSLYSRGFIDLKQFKNFKSEFEDKSKDVLCSGGDRAGCAKALSGYFKKYLDKKIRYNEPVCAGENQLASAGACCEGLLKMPRRNPDKGASCGSKGNSCASHGDCCSKLCVKGELSQKVGKCAPELSCTKLVEAGGECGGENSYCGKGASCVSVDHNSSGIGECLMPGGACGSDSDCCSDKCSKGKCVENKICLKCAGRGKKAQSGECCPGLHKNTSGVCVEDLPPFEALMETSALKLFLQKASSFLFARAHAAECVLDNRGLTQEQSKAYKACLDSAVEASFKSGLKKEYIDEKCEGLRTEWIQSNKEKNCVSRSEESFTREDYRSAHQSPVLAVVKKSDAKNCEFNSFKDAWAAKSDQARNAELALMGFEFVHSGKGEDMIISGPKLEPGKSKYWGESIFSRAQKVAIKLRENRRELVEKYQDIDEEMTCKCLATFGLSHFDPEKNGDAEEVSEASYAKKKDYFESKCKSEKGYVTEDSVDKGKDAMVSGEVSATTEIDKGAVGITHEKLMIEWLGLRKKAQIAHFQNNEKLEEELMDLSEFIENYPWVKTPTIERKSHQLHEFTYWWRSDFASVTAGDSDKAGEVDPFEPKEEYSALYEQGKINQITYNTLLGLFNGDSEVEPSVEDVQTRGKYCYKKTLGVCLKRAKDYRRDLLYPFFDNSKISAPKKASNRCRINGLASSCIKSVYTVDHKFEYSGVAELQNRPLLDVPLPISIEESAYKVEGLEGGGTFAKRLDLAFTNQALPAMKATDDKYLNGGVVNEEQYHPSMRFDIFKAPVDAQTFVVGKGTWKPKKFNQYKAAFVNGAKAYALCKNLKSDGCVKHSTDLLGSRPDDAVGLGHLFESEEDALDFANYAYEMHVIFPRAAAEDRIAYPTQGLNAYYASMAYNLRLVGSLALRRSIETDQLYNLYLADWEKRKGDYKGLGGAETGTNSKNVELTDKFWAEVKTLDFGSPASIRAFSAKVDDYEKANKYGKADLEALRSVANHALRGQEEREAAQDYIKGIGATSRGQKKISAAKSVFSATLKKTGASAPSSKAALASLGNSRSGQSNGANMPKQGRASEATMPSPRSGSGDFGDLDLGYSEHSGASIGFGGDGNSGGLNRGLSDSEAEVMVQAAAQDKSLDDAAPGDSIWKVVSKAYKRNLSRVLVLKSDRAQSARELAAPKEEISDGEKSELKRLLEKN